MSRPAEDLLHELSTLKQRTAETESRMRESLKRALGEWRRTFDTVSLPVVVLDGQGCVMRVNRAALRLMGRPLEQLQLLPLGGLDLPAPWPQVVEFVEAVQRDPTAVSTRLEEPGGAIWELTVSPDDAEPAESARVILVLEARGGGALPS
ncbi:PAS domain-containing protein [Myxococcaceae bacterium GXIMD 01537]